MKGKDLITAHGTPWASWDMALEQDCGCAIVIKVSLWLHFRWLVMCGIYRTIKCVTWEILWMNTLHIYKTEEARKISQLGSRVMWKPPLAPVSTLLHVAFADPLADVWSGQRAQTKWNIFQHVCLFWTVAGVSCYSNGTFEMRTVWVWDVIVSPHL